MKKKIVFIKQFHSETPLCRKLSNSSEMQNDALMHREGLKGLTIYPPNFSIWIFTHLKLCLADAIHNFK